MMAATLENTDTKRLKELEKVIERGKQSFVEMGMAITEIRDSKLYKKDFSTFEEYCLKRWGWSKRYVYNLIDSAKAVTEMCAIAHKRDSPDATEPREFRTPSNEAQARVLSSVKNTVLRNQIWQEANKIATEKNTPVTASLLKIVIKDKIPVIEKASTREQDGREIIQKLDEIRKSLTDSQKIYDPYLKKCIDEIRHYSTLSTNEREESALLAMESCSHTVQEIADDCHFSEPEVKLIISSLDKQEKLFSRSRYTTGGSAKPTLWYSKRKPCSCV